MSVIKVVRMSDISDIWSDFPVVVLDRACVLVDEVHENHLKQAQNIGDCRNAILYLRDVLMYCRTTCPSCVCACAPARARTHVCFSARTSCACARWRVWAGAR